MSKRKTSKEAFEKIKPIRKNMREQIYEYIKNQKNGATCEEVEKALSMIHQTVGARITELTNQGLLVDTKKTKKTSNGRDAIIWKAAHQPNPIQKQIKIPEYHSVMNSMLTFLKAAKIGLNHYENETLKNELNDKISIAINNAEKFMIENKILK